MQEGLGSKLQVPHAMGQLIELLLGLGSVAVVYAAFSDARPAGRQRLHITFMGFNSDSNPHRVLCCHTDSRGAQQQVQQWTAPSQRDVGEATCTAPQ